MKAIKFLLCIVGFALTSICFGQLLPQDNSDILFYAAYYNSIDDRFEHQVLKYHERIASGDQFDVPVISRTYFDAVDTPIDIELWMTLPFESNLYEEDQMIESWMLSPFESDYYEAEVPIESWMTAPFESCEEFEDEIEIEPWMTTPWI